MESAMNLFTLRLKDRSNMPVQYGYTLLFRLRDLSAGSHPTTIDAQW